MNVKEKKGFFSFWISGVILVSMILLPSATTNENAELKIQYQELKAQLLQLSKFEKVAATTFHKASLIYPTDKDPLDIVLRRVNAMLDWLQENNKGDYTTFRQQVANIEKKAAEISADKEQDREKLYMDLCKLRRKIMFSIPELSFNDILFIKRNIHPEPEMEGNHMCDQFFGFHSDGKGGLFILKDAFSDHPTAKNLLENSTPVNGDYQGQKLIGGFLSPELNYDADEIMFAYTKAEQSPYTWNTNTTFHVFKTDLNGENLTQLTFGTTNDFDPCYLPNGRVAFISERRGGYGRCHARPVPSFTLHTMHTDGSDIVTISPHETNEWQPSVNNDGMILFTRWDYVDRGHGQAHHPWTCYPDGRDPRDVHGNYVPDFQGSRANMELNLRAIPNSSKYVATTAGHHAQAYGSLIIIDPNVPDDNGFAPIKRLTPEQLFPEVEFGIHTGEGMYATAYPLNEYFYLCVYSVNANDGSRPTDQLKNNYGIYLIDAFGNKELLYRDPTISCYDPIPVMKRKLPPVIPHRTLVGLPPVNGQKQEQIPADQLPKTGHVSLINVYNTRYPFPEGTKIKELRIVQLLPKTTPNANDPQIGYGNQKGARQILGTVPVAEDGSAYFELPVDIPVYFQAIDENGIAIQTMRSATWVAPGETLSCKGCHENRREAVRSNNFPMAMREKAAIIKKDVEGSNPFSFPRLVQPVLDAKCAACHTDNIEKGVKAPDLRKTLARSSWNTSWWYTSYANLQPYSAYYDNDFFTVAESKPGEFGSYASKLYQMLKEGHHDVKLTDEEMHRITLWLDNNANFYGAHENTQDQLDGKAVYPTLY